MTKLWAVVLAGFMLMSCQKSTTREVRADNAVFGDDRYDPLDVTSAYVDAKTQFPPWPLPKTLRVVQINASDFRQIMEVSALQGLVNRKAPDGQMVYLLGRNFPDADWLKYYTSELNLEIIQTSVPELLDWVRQSTGIRYYIIVDPATSSQNIDLSHSCTINIACTIAGIMGNAIPVSPGNALVLANHGYSLLPDAYCDSLGRGGRKLRRPEAFDLRNQWKSTHPDSPWKTRRDAYQWALDVLLPLVDHHSITINKALEPLDKQGNPLGTEPWITDYSIGLRQFHFYLDPSPQPENVKNRTPYDRLFYRRLLKESGPMTMLRGWHGDEGSNLELLSRMHCFHFGSNDQANASVHAALSPLFTEPFRQREVKPEDVELDPGRIYLTFSVTDGDQPSVVYRGWKTDPFWTGRTSLWDDPARGQIPINWTLSGLAYVFDRGIMRYYFDQASPQDYFTSDLPVGYAFITYERFGSMLTQYDAFVNRYLEKSGMPVAAYQPGGFTLISDSTVAIHVRELTHALAVREGYQASFYQGIYWPEERPLMPYIRNTISAGDTGYATGRDITQNVTRMIADFAGKIPFRPLFMHLTWSNWFQSPSDMQACVHDLEKAFPGKYQLVGLPEFIALAQKAKMSGQFPLEFYPHPNGETGLEAPYLWQQKDAVTSSREEREHPWRGTRNGFITYKFNVAPARRASLSVDLAGDNFRLDVSGDNRAWMSGLIQGSSPTPVARNADLTPYLNSRGCVYLRFAGGVKVYHVKVEYGP